MTRIAPATAVSRTSESSTGPQAASGLREVNNLTTRRARSRRFGLVLPGSQWCCLVSACWALACSGDPTQAPGEFSDTPAAVSKSSAGQFEIKLYSSPTATPIRGENHVRLDVTRRSGDEAPLTPTLVTFMPAMGHGSGVVPKLTEVEGQMFTFEDVVLNMPGHWELRLELESESDDGSTDVDQAVFEFDVD